MKQSFTYYLTHLVIRLKGLKKNFSQDPIPYQKIRKEDVYRAKGKFFKENISRIFQIATSEITEISQKTTSNKLLIFVHGGAFISGPGQHHWDSIKEIAKNTDYNIWMCNYPKAPKHKIIEISKNIDLIYSTALEQYQSSQIVLIGDSVGGSLITALTQRLIKEKKALPNRIILVCPVMDATMTNSEIEKVDPIDPILSKIGLLSAKKMCAENDLKNVVISPLYGNFEQFPQTILYLAENDITYPDQKLVVNKLKEANVNFKVIIGENMPHIWPFLPIMKEAKLALHNIIKTLNNNTL